MMVTRRIVAFVINHGRVAASTLAVHLSAWISSKQMPSSSNNAQAFMGFTFLAGLFFI